MKINLITIFPEMIRQSFKEGVVGQSIERGTINLNLINPRDFSTDIHRSVDDRPFGGGDGMVMSPEVLEKALISISNYKNLKKIYLSPQGRLFNDQIARELSQTKEFVLISGRYGGVDQRFISQHVDEELSIGNYVLSGGELAAAVVIDAVGRHIPGVLGHEQSANQDSFISGWFEQPQFTRPQNWNGVAVPSVLLSGNHQAIEHWKKQVSRLVTLKKRPELFWSNDIQSNELQELKKFYGSLSLVEKQIMQIENIEFSAL